MKRLLVLFILGVGCLMMTSYGRAADITGNLNLLLGQKMLRESDWKEEGVADFSKQFEIGVMFDFRGKTWPVNIAVDLLSSKKTETISGIDVDGKTSEFAMGVRKYFMEDRVAKPYVGGGLASIKGEFTSGVLSISDSAVGPWVDAGVKFNPVERINLGVDARYSYAKPKVEEFEFQAGGWHVGVFAGLHF